MLSILLTLNGFTQKIFFKEIVDKTNFSYTNSDNTFFSFFICLEVEDNSLVYNESETSEFEIELDWASFYSLQKNYLEGNLESENESHFDCFHETSQNIHLYDLFCNWKLHLS